MEPLAPISTAGTGHMIFHEADEPLKGVFLAEPEAIKYSRLIRRLMASHDQEAARELEVFAHLLETTGRAGEGSKYGPPFPCKDMPRMKIIDAISEPPADGTRYSFPYWYPDHPAYKPPLPPHDPWPMRAASGTLPASPEPR